MENEKRSKRDAIEGFTRYHLAFCARHRRKVFGIAGFNAALQHSILQTCSNHHYELLDFNPHSDYLHLVLVTPPFVGHSDAVYRIKSESKYLAKEFKELQSMPNLWTLAYFVSTESEAPTNDILNFVNHQKKA